MDTMLQQSLIVPSIDWFQGVFNNVDFAYILHDFLGIDYCPYEDPEVMQSFEIRMGYDWQVGFNYNGIIITTNKDKLLSARDEGDVFHYVFESVQLKVTGEGMRYLRSINPEIETDLHNRRVLDELGVASWHITRADFAFDLINYDVDFLGDLVQYLNGIYFSGGRTVPTIGVGRPQKFEVRSGAQSTVYVGGTRSPKLLRVYDKLIESKGDLSKLPCELPDDFVVDSWCRIEFQTRQEWAFRVFYGTCDWESRFKEVYNQFAFCDENREICDFWSELFDWEVVPSIIQNAKWAEPVLTKGKLENRLDTLLVQILPFLYSAPKHWLKWFEDEIRRIEKDLMEPGMEKSYRNLNVRMKTAILADVPRDADFKLLDQESYFNNSSVIKSLRNVSFIPRNGFNHWRLL